MERNGILSAGNFIIDAVKIIDGWPQQEALADIDNESYANGGGAYNLLIDLAKLQAGIPLYAAGLLGADAFGDRVLLDLQQHGIDIRQMHQTVDAATSYTDVMTVGHNGKRTFFHQRGANALLAAKHIDLKLQQPRIFYLAYLMLLNGLDTIDAAGRTGASYLLQEAQQAGCITATDLVSVSHPQCRQIVGASLPFTDVLFLNEYEGSQLTGVQTLQDEQINAKGFEEAATHLLQQGVQRWVVLHHPHAALAAGADGSRYWHASVNMPAEKIAGCVGAGDAFAAGILYGLHKNQPMPACLTWGVCAAAASLQHPTSSDGVMPLQACLQLGEQFGFRPLPF
jgi:sugar/nucleoside kinase (ribokinase family)